MTAGENLEQLLGPTISALGYELLGIERSRSTDAPLLRLYIDSPDGIGVDDCERVSRQVGDLIEAEEAIRGSYTLEVSSPGMDRPLFNLEHYRKHLGSEVQMRLRTLVNGRRRLVGALTAVAGETVSVRVDGENFDVPFNLIERTRLVPDWSQKK